MRPEECRELIDDYVAWLRGGLSVAPVGEACELTTPFLDRHNDHLQVYLRREDGKLRITDDGYILSDLEASGLDFNTSKRQELLNATLRGLGVKREGGELVVEASPGNASQRLHMLIQAMLAINDLFALARPRVASLFREDVELFLTEHRVRFIADVKFAGISGFDHYFDFVIARSNGTPDRVLRAINSPNRDSVSVYSFAVSDTRSARRASMDALAFLNDAERRVGGDILDALQAYQIKPVLWSERERALPFLTA